MVDVQIYFFVCNVVVYCCVYCICFGVDDMSVNNQLCCYGSSSIEVSVDIIISLLLFVGLEYSGVSNIGV